MPERDGDHVYTPAQPNIHPAQPNIHPARPADAAAQRHKSQPGTPARTHNPNRNPQPELLVGHRNPQTANEGGDDVIHQGRHGAQRGHQHDVKNRDDHGKAHPAPELKVLHHLQ